MQKKESLLEKDNIPTKKYVDIETGEVKTGVVTETKYIEQNLKAIEEKQNKAAWRKKRTENRIAYNELARGKGYYFFKYVSANDIDYALLFRFLYLCTYANNDSFISFKKSYIREHELNLVFSNMHQNTVSQLKSDLLNTGLITIENNRVKVNDILYSKYTLDKKDYNKATRVFINGIRALYDNSLCSQHKDIGKIVPLLQYMHKDYNILCYEVDELDKTRITPLTLTEICKILGYYPTNITRLRRKLINIKVDDKPLIMNVVHAKLDGFVINPMVFYKGTNIDIINEIKKFSTNDYFELKNK